MNIRDLIYLGKEGNMILILQNKVKKNQSETIHRICYLETLF